MAAPKRLSKVARELNVGISTIVEFLADQGQDIDTSPNTKLEPAVYEMLLDEFQADRGAKEKAEEASRQKKEERKTITIDRAEEVVETVKVEVPKPEEKIVKPSVVGKIDLDKVESSTRPVKKEEEPKVEPPKPKEAVKEVKVEAEKAPEVEEADKPIETIKVQKVKLSGPTVLGKIELPVEKEKPKKDNDANKRKRKRIKKVNIEKTGANVAKQVRKTTRKDQQKNEVSQEEIQKEIKDTLARLSGKGKSKSVKQRRAKRDAHAEKREEEMMIQQFEDATLKVTEFVTVSELATMMDKSPTDIISTLMSIGIFASINQRLDAETLTMVAEEFGYSVEFVGADVQETIEEEEDDVADLEPRCPIVTVMGHVDHGKTSLLDFIRDAKVTEGEAGGITQHIGAYNVQGESGRRITFLDTPGHEAFTAMRARGAQVTDIAIIIIAADDEVMPQTKEAINHAQAAGVPMVFAFNKCDREASNPDRIREQLSAMNILVEDWGGKFQSQEVSAKTGQGVDDLLEKVLLEAELLELKANPKKKAVGTVIESTLDKGRGYVTTLLVEAGTLHVGDVLVAGTQMGKVKAMHNEKGELLEEVLPSYPVSLLGMNGPSSAGDRFNVMADEKEAKGIATRRQQLQREQGIRTTKHITLDEIGRRLAIGDFKELNLIVKGDVDGSIEALSDSLIKLGTEQIQVNIIHKAIGQITESDVLLATASDAIIIGFQVRPSAQARKIAEKEEIDIRLYSVIYKAIEEIKDAMEGMLSPDIEESITGSVEVRETFKISKVGTIAGCFVVEGQITRNSQIRLIREGIVIYTGALGSLKRFKDDVKEVKHGYECGLNIDKFNDIKEGDIIEAYEQVEVARKLK
ncbi:translation initiation factor IF-2 [Flavobacteriales bacterium]|nr:translation initiation factor IF-2 [Flavobacteriales bacterium]